MGQVIRGGEQFETAIQADHRGQLLKQGADSGAVDAFGRQRVSQPFTLFDSVEKALGAIDAAIDSWLDYFDTEREKWFQLKTKLRR